MAFNMTSNIDCYSDTAPKSLALNLKHFNFMFWVVWVVLGDCACVRQHLFRESLKTSPV